MKLSIVTTLYMSAPYVTEFCKRASFEAQKLFEYDYEIIIVNDGSPDGALDIAVKAAEQDKHITIVDFSRNFGHHKALMTGLEFAKGEFVFLIDADLEEEPEWLSEFFNRMISEECDVVYGVQKERKGRMFERISGGVFYKLINLLTGLKMPENIVTARLMSRRYVDALLLHREREIFLAGLWHITGFKQVEYKVIKHNTSPSTYTLRKKMAIIMNSVTSFTETPLAMIFYCGIVITIVAFVYIVWIIVKQIISPTTISGWVSTMAAVLLFGGLNASFIGIVGIYLSKIYIEVKQRPYTIVKKVYNDLHKQTEEHNNKI